MNYKFFINDARMNKSGERTFIGEFFMDEWTRPQLGQELRFRIAKGLWKVVGVIPFDNTEGQSNSYIVEKIH